MSKTLLAAILGVKKETLSRLLRDLVERRVIALSLAGCGHGPRKTGRNKMIRRAFLAAALGACLTARAAAAPKLVVHKSAGCGCCGEWEKHMRAHGFELDARTVADIGALKRRLGVPGALASCHTATVEGYVVEGHRSRGGRAPPARAHEAIGLAVPGMPLGAPGMEQDAPALPDHGFRCAPQLGLRAALIHVSATGCRPPRS